MVYPSSEHGFSSSKGHHPRVQLNAEMASGWSFMPLGRVISRFAAIGWLDFYPNVDDMINGFYDKNGKTKYDLGYAFGKLFMLTFDISVG